ncbi:unnamed protein product [Caenorhabditis brenneri]
MSEEVKVIVFNIPVEARMFQVELRHNQRTMTREYVIDGRESESKEGTLLERIMKKSSDSFMIGRKKEDEGEVPLKKFEVTIKKEHRAFIYSVQVDGTALAEYLKRAHWRFFAWELLIDGSKTIIFLHRHTCFLWHKGEKIGTTEEVSGDEKLVSFSIEGKPGSVRIQIINGILTKYLQFEGVQRPELDKWDRYCE